MTDFKCAVCQDTGFVPTPEELHIKDFRGHEIFPVGKEVPCPQCEPKRYQVWVDTAMRYKKSMIAQQNSARKLRSPFLSIEKFQEHLRGLDLDKHTIDFNYGKFYWWIIHLGYLRVLRGNSLSVYCVLIEDMNYKTLLSYISDEQIADRSGISLKRVYKALDFLENGLHLIKRETWKQGNRVKLKNVPEEFIGGTGREFIGLTRNERRIIVLKEPFDFTFYTKRPRKQNSKQRDSKGQFTKNSPTK